MSDKENDIDHFCNDASKEWSKDTEYIEYLNNEPIESMGRIPENHEGPFIPTKEEWIQGAEFVLKCKIQNLQLRKIMNNTSFNSLFAGEKK